MIRRIAPGTDVTCGMENSRESLRCRYFDVVKGVGILCVFMGHSFVYGALPSRMIFNFHMPLFMVVSGVFLRYEKFAGFRAVWRRVTFGLLIPWCLFTVIDHALRPEFHFPQWWAYPELTFLWTLHGYGGPSLWYLMCLGAVIVFAWAVYRLASRQLVWERPWFRFGLLAVTAVTAHLVRLVPIDAQFWFPFALSSVPGCLFFFFAGSFSRDWLLGFRQTQGRRLGRAVVGFVVSFALLAGLSACLNHTFNLCLARFHVALLPMCVAGLSTVFFGAALADRAGGIGAVLAWMGRHGLCLFAMEHPIDSVFCKVLSLCGYAARPVPNCYEHSHLYGVFRTVVVLAVCAALVPVFEWILVSFRRLLSNDMKERIPTVAG